MSRTRTQIFSPLKILNWHIFWARANSEMKDIRSLFYPFHRKELFPIQLYCMILIVYFFKERRTKEPHSNSVNSSMSSQAQTELFSTLIWSKNATAIPTLIRRSMSASTLEIVILCMTMSIMRRSRACHFWRADLEKLLALPAAPALARPAGLRCNFFLLLGGDRGRLEETRDIKDVTDATEVKRRKGKSYESDKVKRDTLGKLLWTNHHQPYFLSFFLINLIWTITN